MRTGAIALIAGAALAYGRGGLARWPMATLLLLWPAFGGHWVELWFLNWLRPRLSDSRTVHAATRVGVWFVGGSVLTLGMRSTAVALAGFWSAPLPPWWLGGLGFIGIELVVHLIFRLSGKPSFYDGRG